LFANHEERPAQLTRGIPAQLVELLEPVATYEGNTRGWREARVYFQPFSLRPRSREIAAPELPLTGWTASTRILAVRKGSNAHGQER
jgi:hypothetical protein